MTGSAVVLASGVAGVAAARSGSAGERSSIVLSKPLPNVVRIAERVTVTGRVPTPPRGARVALESARTANWRIVASTSMRGSGAFRLTWQIGKRTAPGPVKLRLVVIRRGLSLIRTAPLQSYVGPAAVYCKPPVPPAVNVPVGDGWIVGGVYGVGGAFPGIDACSSAAYTVTATDTSGAVVASETVAALHSYTLVVPAGSYTLTSGVCRGTATVTAGRETEADTNCDYP
jgi:hypothetical protein